MASSLPHSRLTPLQSDLLAAFFAREQSFFLTGGGALAGFYFGHRSTEDLDFFGPPGVDLADAARSLQEAAAACGASLKAIQTGTVRVDTLREIAANKICTLLSRAEIKDLVDLEQLLGHGQDLEHALADAVKKDAGVDPATLAWLLEQVSIGPESALPGGVDPKRIVAFRDDLTRRLRALAFASAKRE